MATEEPVCKERIYQLIRETPGITTPELGRLLGVSVTRARWFVYQCSAIEFYDGNHIRFKEGE